MSRQNPPGLARQGPALDASLKEKGSSYMLCLEQIQIPQVT